MGFKRLERVVITMYENYSNGEKVAGIAFGMIKNDEITDKKGAPFDITMDIEGEADFDVAFVTLVNGLANIVTNVIGQLFVEHVEETDISDEQIDEHVEKVRDIIMGDFLDGADDLINRISWFNETIAEDGWELINQMIEKVEGGEDE